MQKYAGGYSLRDRVQRNAAAIRGVALGAAAACLVLVLVQPLWGLTLWSIQFPNGLRMIVYPGAIKGNISDINVLNHYIGMAPVSDDLFPELRFLPVVFIVTAAVCLLAIVFRKRILTLAPLLLLAATAVYGFVSMQKRLYQYGNELDPEAAITMSPFTPPMFGEFRIAQFVTYSYFGLGTTLAVTAGLLVFLAAWLDFTRVRT